MLSEALATRRREIEGLLVRCESPIEQIMLLANWECWRCRVAENRHGMHTTLEGKRLLGDDHCERSLKDQASARDAEASA
jgi:hypothetical protein